MPASLIVAIDQLECERAFLESLGYTALIAPSSNKALELASIHSVDVVVAVQNYTVCLLGGGNSENGSILIRFSVVLSLGCY